MQTASGKIVEGDSETRVDYVHLLPAELWRKIVQLALPTPSSTPQPSLTTFFYGDLVLGNWRHHLHLQHLRAQLRGICKTLEPLVLESLLDEVIFCLEWISRFYNSLEAMGSKTWSPNILIKRAIILLPDVVVNKTTAAQYAQLGKLHEHCPNLRSITTFVYYEGFGGRRPIDVGWVHNATFANLQLPSFATTCLVKLADQNPELETLALIAAGAEGSATQLQSNVTFPQLKRFFISDQTVFSRVSAPKLEWLGFKMVKASDEGLRNFVRSNCTGLTQLHLHISHDVVEGMPWILYLLFLCPQLQTLSLEGYTASGRSSHPSKPHPSLQHLILHCDTPSLPKRWLEMFGLGIGSQPFLSFETIKFRLFYRYGRKVDTFDKNRAAAMEEIEKLCGTLDSVLIFEEVL